MSEWDEHERATHFRDRGFLEESLVEARALTVLSMQWIFRAELRLAGAEGDVAGAERAAALLGEWNVAK